MALTFADRQNGPREKDVEEMLRTIGVSSLDELTAQTVPQNILLDKPLDLPEGMTEHEYLSGLKKLAAKNKPFRSLIGMGFYGTQQPAVITRNIFENPTWYTSYTPYQAEISQGRLEALMVFQTMISSLTGFDLANCSMLDDATAAGEAMRMMYNLRSRDAVKEGRNVVFVDENVFPQVLSVIRTRARGLGLKVETGRWDGYEFGNTVFGAILQYPAANGEVRDYKGFCDTAHSHGIMVTAVCDLLALALYKEPAAWGADIAVGSAQRFGLPMGFGGPCAGFMACSSEHKRFIPGRIIGISEDRLGHIAYRLALQTREQHIKRENATSNICTATALMAIMAGMYAVYQGPKGVRSAASTAYIIAHAVGFSLTEEGFKLASENYFDTIEVVSLDHVDADTERSLRQGFNAIKERALAAGYNFYYTPEGNIRISFDELSNIAEAETVCSIFGIRLHCPTKCAACPEDCGTGKPQTGCSDHASADCCCSASDNASANCCCSANDHCGKPQCPPEAGKRQIPDFMARETAILTQKVFNSYFSETEMMRYLDKLVRRDLSLAQGMIPLGSCTMKLNAAVGMIPLTWSEFGDVHPYAPADQCEGSLEMIREIEHDLCVITGFSACSLQPNSGAAGEYAGLMTIKNYLHATAQDDRDVMLIPASAHGTNPASAAMAGFKVVVTPCDATGDIDVEALIALAATNSTNLAGLMVTYPSTHGIFESRIRDIVDAIHSNGGIVYMDGANMNAQVGITNPATIGADLCHLNLHKTFAMPHGGGGPGVGPICTSAKLAPFIPGHPVVPECGGEGMTAVSAAPYGSPALLPVTYAYIKMLGASGLRSVSQIAILNANYVAARLEPDFKIFYKGANGRVGHECIIDVQNFKADYGVDAGDLSKRLMDYGFHAPTLSFPVHETLMFEPTESESKEALDRFVDTMKSILGECRAIAAGTFDTVDNPVKMAPHTAEECTSDSWSHPYGRELAAYPLPCLRTDKFWPFSARIDNASGDRNLRPVLPE